MRHEVLKAFTAIRAFTIAGYERTYYNNKLDKTQNAYKLTRSHSNHIMLYN